MEEFSRYDTLDRVTNMVDGIRTTVYTYTSGGQLESKGGLFADDTVNDKNIYDPENRLVQWEDSGIAHPVLTDFVYDGLGRLRERLEYIWVTGVGGDAEPDTGGGGGGGSWNLSYTTLYIYDGKRVIQERNGSGTPLTSYTRGNDLSGSMEGAGGIGGLLARSSGYSSGSWTSHAYYHADGNGNITCLNNSSQSVVASYIYDLFGNTISSSGTLAATNVYRFSSKECHVNSGMYYYLYRFYDPNLQRWINRDPIEEEGGLNLYECVENNPASFLDPDGGKPMTFPIPLPKSLPIRLPPALGPVLGPIGIAITCGTIGAAAIDVCCKLYYDKKKTRCDQEWEDAFKLCKDELSKPNPSRESTGGYKNIMDCARGHVSEECGGNPVDYGKKKKKPRTIRFN